mmetsp:Transcript_5660/g.11750  ORF Transcript_5660/g.11750 Transcript_5660/m.11750 type:complete len:741 (+) Transcript_5660:263-2485(+)|eukprot:CAMPEP_0168736464 /NCGR_PEP_ID=MMETSP0724-20121128/9875_1 /TAXON_ID=265536 /ORGANISM="Amphiprora sp., Strain CCMP467" /LENGTH=740 /DNA_ID=CAMNT_0008783665 /DNA_START=243 /DNA_END=2465 /DNA_ORIENTATION=-
MRSGGGGPLSELMSSNSNGPTGSNNESKADGGFNNASLHNVIEQQQQQQLLLQQLQQQGLPDQSFGGLQNLPTQVSSFPQAGATFDSSTQKSQQEQFLAAMMKRQAEQQDAAEQPSSKRARGNNTDQQAQDASAPAPSTMHPSDQLNNRAWGPNVMLEPTPLGTTADYSAQLDFLNSLRDSSSGLPSASGFGSAGAGGGAPGLNSNPLLADQLLLQDVSAHQLLQDHLNNNNALLGSLGAQPYDSLLAGAPSAPQAVGSSGMQLPFGMNAAAVAANPMGQLFSSFPNPQVGAIQQAPTASASFAALAPSTGAAQGIGGAGGQQQAALDDLMRQLSATQNQGPFGGAPGMAPHPSFHGGMLLQAAGFHSPDALNSLSVALGGAGAPSGMTTAAEAPNNTMMGGVTAGGLVNSNAASMARPLLPPLDEGRVPHFTERPKFCLGIDEDPNWLSEFHCFVRSELIEVCRAGPDDCKTRNNAIRTEQVGIRCRFCAHKPSNARAGRSSAFPSSLRQIYQSFTMMLREHFPNCDRLPQNHSDTFSNLKDKPSQGATNSKEYWSYSAMKLGLTDSSHGIVISEDTVNAGSNAPPFGTTENEPWTDDETKAIQLVNPADRPLVAEFLFVLLSQVQVVRLRPSERIGNRRSLQAGLPGLACRACCDHRRLGLCRLFPARRRTLPSKLGDMYDHLRRCNLVPKAVKDHLERLKQDVTEDSMSDRDDSKEFFDRLWCRMGHGGGETSGSTF